MGSCIRLFEASSLKHTCVQTTGKSSRKFSRTRIYLLRVSCWQPRCLHHRHRFHQQIESLNRHLESRRALLRSLCLAPQVLNNAFYPLLLRPKPSSRDGAGSANRTKARTRKWQVVRQSIKLPCQVNQPTNIVSLSCASASIEVPHVLGTPQGPRWLGAAEDGAQVILSCPCVFCLSAFGQTRCC